MSPSRVIPIISLQRISAALLLVGAACGGGSTGPTTPPPPPPPPASSITMVAPGSVAVGGTLRATAILIGAGTITWSSQSPSVATIDGSGNITGQTPGEATIMATSGAVSQTATVTVFPPLADLSLGSINACARSADRALYCWGGNGTNQLGPIVGNEICNGDTKCSTTPRHGISTPVFAQVAIGYGIGCGVTDAGELYCWGNNTEGIFGSTPGNCCVAQPIRMPGSVPLSRIGVGRFFGCGLDGSGKAYCWGVAFPSYGTLGANATDQCPNFPCSLAPAPVAGGLVFNSLSVGQLHSCGLTAGGDAYCWGSNGTGAIGNGVFSGVEGGEAAPRLVQGGIRFASISAGEIHTCGVSVAGKAYCWGSNIEGQTGAQGNFLELVPAAVVGGLVFSSIQAGGAHTCGLTVAGAAYCWGEGRQGQLGNGGTESQNHPIPVARNLVFTELAVRRQHACGRTAAGRIYCWGQNLYGQLGVGEGRAEILFLSPTGVGGAP